MKKGVLIILGYLIIGFIVSCCEPITHPYFDFKSIKVETTVYESDSTSQDFDLEFSLVLEDNLLYSQSNVNIFNTAFATQPCPENGNEGLKFPIVDIKITCNQIYFDTIPVNTDISHFFYTREYSDSIILLDDLDINMYFMAYRGGINPFLPILYLEKNNLPGVAHIFSFDLEKANGEVVSANSESISW